MTVHNLWPRKKPLTCPDSSPAKVKPFGVQKEMHSSIVMLDALLVEAAFRVRFVIVSLMTKTSSVGDGLDRD